MNSITFFLSFIPFLALILLSINLIFAPHNSYQEKSSTFECGFHSFLGQNRTQFNISFFVFGLLFLLFDMELVLLFPGALTLAVIDIYGLILMLVFFVILTAGFAFELGKKALNIDSRQNENKVNYGIQHNVFYKSIKYYIAIEYNYYYYKCWRLNWIILSKLNSIILFFYLIIKEYILKFSIIKIIIGFTVIKVISLMLALNLCTIIQKFDSVFTVASYIILLFIVIIIIRTPLKNIPKVFITLMLNSIVIGSIIILVNNFFNLEIFSGSTLAAYTYIMSQDLDIDSFINAKGDKDPDYDWFPAADEPWGWGPGPIPPGPHPCPNPNPGPNPGPGSGPDPGPGPDPGNDPEEPKRNGPRRRNPVGPEQMAKAKNLANWNRFVGNWSSPDLHTEVSSKVTRVDLLNSIERDVEIRPKDSRVIYNAITEIFKHKWPQDINKDPVFLDIKQALNKNPDDAFKYKDGDGDRDKIRLVNTVKRIDAWTWEDVIVRKLEHKYLHKLTYPEPEVIPPKIVYPPKVSVSSLLN